MVQVCCGISLFSYYCCHWSNSRLQHTKNELIDININLPIRFKCSLIEGARTPFRIVPAHFNPWLKFTISFSGVHFSSCWGNQLQTKTAASQGLWSWHKKTYGGCNSPTRSFHNGKKWYRIKMDINLNSFKVLFTCEKTFSGNNNLCTWIRG